MVPCGSLWFPMVPDGALYFLMIPYGFLCPVVLYGPRWSPVPYGSLWFPMVTYGPMVTYHPSSKQVLRHICFLYNAVSAL